MARLILVKHSKSQMTPGVDSHDWPLSEEGRARALSLAEALRAYAPATIVSSPEAKALETARIVGAALAVEVTTHPGLGEHDRHNVPLQASRDFIAGMALFFQKPSQLVMGNETAQAAGERFGAAIREILDAHAGKDVAVVTHGTVLSLHAAPKLAVAAFTLWRRMDMPSYIAFDVPEYKLICEVDRV